MGVEFSSFREGDCRRKVAHGKPRVRNLSKERVYELVRVIVFQIRDRIIKENRYGSRSLTAEQLATELQVDPAKVKWALHRLNLCGLVSQKRREFAHDTNRNPIFFGPASGWAANSYAVFVYPPRSGPIVSPRPWSPPGTLPAWDEIEPKKKSRFSKRLGRRVGPCRGY